MKDRVKKLEQEIIVHKRLYYAGNAKISDEEYDQLEEELRSLSPSSPVLDMVGSDIFSGKKVKHTRKMLILQKTYVEDDLNAWIDGKVAVSTFKYDGSSCSLVYEAGKLSVAKTRGNGVEGENITDKVYIIPNIPQNIDDMQTVEIRGEIIIDESSFMELATEMVSLGLEKPQSQRNIVAGILGRKENIDLSRFLHFVAFEYIVDTRDFSTEVEKFKKLHKYGFEVPAVTVHKKKLDKPSIAEAKSFMSEGDFLIDGLVFSYNDLLLHDNLGETAHHPRYKMAFKFQGEAKVTNINEILWQVSRNGVLTPVADVKPVELSGAMISRVTLHNWGVVKSFDLQTGDEIKIIRSGEVIPKFLEKLNKSESPSSHPANCPSCGEKVYEEDIRVICKNSTCPDQVKHKILHYLKTMGIEDLSDKRLAEMLKQNMVFNIKSLYELTSEQLLTLDKTKDKLASKILSNIEGSKGTDLVTFLASFGISGAGKNKIQKIVDSGFQSLSEILKLKKEQLEEVESFAEKSAEEFITHLKDLKSQIQDVTKTVKPVFVQTVKKNTLEGKSFCITGTLSMKRSDLQNMVKENGGKVSSGVSKNLDYLITNDENSNSSKFKQAKDLKVSIISETDFFEMLKS
jgi:DNA ligase (NAD+)